MHIFFDCPLVKDCVNKYLRRYGNLADLDGPVAKKTLFLQVRQMAIGENFFL